MEDLFDKLKDKVKEFTRKVTDKDTRLGDDYDKSEYKTEGEQGEKELMSPERIRKHGPTAVKRDQDDQNIVEQGQSDTDSQQAREEYKKKGNDQSLLKKLTLDKLLE